MTTADTSPTTDTLNEVYAAAGRGIPIAVVDDDGTVDIRQVEMGPRVDNEWIVESGLEAGERIALEGLQRLRPGTKVVPNVVSAAPGD